MSTELSIKKQQIEVKRAEFQLFSDLAKQFAAAKAFPSYTPEQLFVLMKAGQEMGMAEMEAVNSLYIVNGKVERSEEHTSELQSRGHIVCRLLLEKKNSK